MTDIVKCLRSFVVDEPDYGKGLLMSIGPEDVERAAAEIERLRAALDEAQQAFALASYNAKRLRAALRDIIADSFSLYAIDVARAALKEDGK